MIIYAYIFLQTFEYQAHLESDGIYDYGIYDYGIYDYGVATNSRLLKSLGLFRRIYCLV